MFKAVLAAACATLAQPPTPAQIDALVKDTIEQWHVPGLAVAIVHQERVVYLKGFGVKEVGKPGAVTADSIFPLASCSKPFTTLALGMLVDEGKLDWDDPVRKHLPWFRLADPLADANVTLRDLLSHRTGLARHDWLWYRAPWTLEERVRKLALLQPKHSFRSTFEYQTIAFGAAGLALGSAAKKPWHELVRQRILEPLDMKSAGVVAPTGRAEDLASPHRRRGKDVTVMARYPLDQPDPAGSIHASARDLTKFLRLQLSDGVWQGRRLISAQSLAELHTPQTLIRREGFARAVNPDTRVLSYGLGWIVQDYRGRWLSMHGGAIDGFRTHLTLVPEAGLGIALCTNLDKTMMNLALSNLLVDRFCGLPPKDWNGYIRAVQDEDDRIEKLERAQLLAARRPDTKPTLPLAAYAGEYVDPAYGTCRVTLEKGKLTWQWSSLTLPLEHFRDDTFLAEEEFLFPGQVTFRVNAAGGVESLDVLERTFRKRFQD